LAPISHAKRCLSPRLPYHFFDNAVKSIVGQSLSGCPVSGSLLRAVAIAASGLLDRANDDFHILAACLGSGRATQSTKRGFFRLPPSGFTNRNCSSNSLP
jgi:hypothetical protein